MSVRLCAKTIKVGEFGAPEPEVCFCNMKLFRDHGAERKLSNDASIIRKRIAKLQLRMKEPCPPERSTKRKRGSIRPKSDFNYSKNNLQLQDKMSMARHNISQQTKFYQRQQKRLEALERSLYSSHPESVLSLRSGHQEDPGFRPLPYIGAHDSEELWVKNRKESSTDGSSSIKSDSAEINRLDTSPVGNFYDEMNDGISPLSLKPNISSAMPGKARLTRFCSQNSS